MIKKKTINFADFYTANQEIRRDQIPYFEFFECIKSTFEDNNDLNSFLDIGCATGNLILEIKKHYQNSIVHGIEYFKYHKDSASNIIKNNIFITDISKPLNLNQQYDLVICTEVAEHIHPSKIHIFLKNLQSVAKNKLIISWSSTYPNLDAPPQHLCCLGKKDVIKLLNKFGFKINTQETESFIRYSKNFKNFYFWWRDSLMVCDKII